MGHRRSEQALLLVATAALLAISGCKHRPPGELSPGSSASTDRDAGTQDLVPFRCEERDGLFVAPAGREVEWTTLASEASLLPNTLDGEPHGHVIDKLEADTLIASCGFRQEDVLLSVNGHSATGLAEALQAYQACLNDREFVFQLERGGDPTEVHIVIEE